MSVSSTTNKVIYTGSGTTGPFDFDFRVFASSDLVVEKYTIATGVTVELTETTDYTVTVDGDGTGSVTTVAAVTSSYKLIIRRVLPITQAIDYVEGDKFPAETHEEGLDRGIMIDQQLQEQIDRAVLQNPTVSTQITLPGAVTGNALVWKADGTLENSDEALVGPTGPQGPQGVKGDDGVVQSVVAGTNVTVDDTDPANPVVSATVTDASLTTTDVTTNNASTSKHGFLKKLSNVATEFMNGVGNWVSMTINDLLPSQTGNSGKFLTTNGSSASWGSSGYVYSSGSVVLLSMPTERAEDTAQVYKKKKWGYISDGGTLSISFDLKRNGGDTVYGRIYRNGVAVGTERETTSTSYVTYSENISGWSAGDTVELWYKAIGSGAQVSVRNFSVMADKSFSNLVVTD